MKLNTGKFIFLILLLTIIFFNCKKSKDNSVQGGYVNLRLSLNLPQYTQLNAIGGWVYIPQSSDAGLKGLIVYRRTLDAYAAYDRACTYDPNNNCQLQVESSGITTIDTCCGSKFEIYYGSVTQAPATQPMIQYKTAIDGSDLYITNF